MEVKPLDYIVKTGQTAFKGVHPAFFLIYLLLIVIAFASWVVVYLINNKYIELLDKYDVLHESKVTLAMTTTEALSASVNSITKISNDLNTAVATNSSNIDNIQEELKTMRNYMRLLLQQYNSRIPLEDEENKK